MMTRTVLTAAIAASLALPLTLDGQTKAAPAANAKAATLTALDYVEIQQLVARYPFAVDTGGNNGYDYADLFTSDGEFMRPYSKGREQLAALARGGTLGPTNTVHYITNHVIEPTSEGAIGREYLFELGPPQPQGARGGGGGQPANGWDIVGRKAAELARTGGHYEDVYMKTAQGWRFKRREFIPSRSGMTPAALDPPRIPADLPKDAVPGAEQAASFVSPTKQTTLTALDYVQIGQLVASYGHALDSGFGKGENGEAYANLYTPDAEFAGASGHAALADLARIQPRGPEFVRHYLTNHVIEPMPGGAKGKEYLVVLDISETGMPGSIFLAGHYEDTYVRTADGWRFKTRRLFPARPGPQQTQNAAGAAAAPSFVAAPAAKSALSADDYLAIQQLVAKASYAIDRLDDGGRAFASLFTPDARLRAPGVDAKGRDSLAAFAAREPGSRGPLYVHEFVADHVIQSAAPRSASGRVYAVGLRIAEGETPGAIENGGHFEDTYVKTADGWRIKSRTYVPSKLGPREKWFWAPPAKAN